MTLIERLRNTALIDDFARLDAADALEKIAKARPLSEYHEDMGPVLWWSFPVEEPPYVGGPNDTGHVVEVTVAIIDGGQKITQMVGGWPGYHTHWTPLAAPTL